MYEGESTSKAYIAIKYIYFTASEQFMHDFIEVTLFSLWSIFFLSFFFRLTNWKHGSEAKPKICYWFSAKEDCVSKKIHNSLKNVYGNVVMDIRNVKKFENGWMEIAYKPRKGRLSTPVTNSNQEHADELIQRDKHIIVHDVVDALNVSYGSAQGIISLIMHAYSRYCLLPRRLQKWVGQWSLTRLTFLNWPLLTFTCLELWKTTLNSESLTWMTKNSFKIMDEERNPRFFSKNGFDAWVGWC